MLSMCRLARRWNSAYFDAQKRAGPLSAAPTDTAIDKRVLIDEQAIYPYLFAGAYLTGCASILISELSPEQYNRAIHAYQSLIDEAERVFIARPTRLKTRLQLTHPLTRFLQTIDGPTNCFPSLHVALVALTYQIIKDLPDKSESLLPALRQSCIDICRSTLPTRQHSIVDVIGGLALSERTYLRFFGGKCEDLLCALIPELRADELGAIRPLIARYDELPILMDGLMTLFQVRE